MNLTKFSLLSLLIVFLSTCFFACKEEDDLKVNQSPDTSFSIEEINLSGDNRLNSIVTVEWYGKDPDGYIVGYEISQDGNNWKFTTTQDSTFQFSLNSGTDTADVELYVRAIDNNNAKDPSPDYIRVPIKNTAPSIEFNADLSLPDTTFLVATTEWTANDLDGEETITQILISINGKSWQEINKTKNVISIAPLNPTSTDTTQARIYYNNESSPASVLLEGLSMNDTNRLYIKAVDQAGAESNVDTSEVFFMKAKKHDILIVGGVESSASITPSKFYQNVFDKINVDYDLLDLLAFNGLYRPKLWNTTFRLQLSFYDKLFFFSDESTYRNSYTNLSAMLLQFAAPSLQEFTNQGGKYMISSTFLHNSEVDDLFGVLPVQSKANSNTSSAVLRQDSALVSPNTDYPKLQSSEFLMTNIGVYNIDPNDTEVLYRAQLNKNFSDPWNDTKVIASGRRAAGDLNQVFFNIQLWKMDAGYDNQSSSLFAVDSLFHQVFNVEFN